MTINIAQDNTRQATNENQFTKLSVLGARLKNGIWVLGIHSWIFGITDRSFASFADGYLSAVELAQLFTASFFFISWLSLKPEETLKSDSVSTLQRYPFNSQPYQDEGYLHPAKIRMAELQNQHLISQEYLLPFPYICQIYHLLNLKHLETIHSFSLNNLRVIGVSQVQPTAIGGMVKFQTILDSPTNALRMWRQPIVEVELTLHSPYTVELSIPAYKDKKIVVFFNTLPISHAEHKLFIDIYSDLEWPRPLLQIILHIASCLTLFEDLPYLRKLAQRNLEQLLTSSKHSSHETMWLFKRFADLYGSRLKPAQPMKAIE